MNAPKNKLTQSADAVNKRHERVHKPTHPDSTPSLILVDYFVITGSCVSGGCRNAASSKWCPVASAERSPCQPDVFC